jgi:hypothetical protein
MFSHGGGVDGIDAIPILNQDFPDQTHVTKTPLIGNMMMMW